MPPLFSIGAIGLTLAGALIWQSEFAYALAYVSSSVDGLLRWWYVALVASWLAMLFAAGTGVGLLFWSIAEPIMHFQGNPFAPEGFTPSSSASTL